MREELSGAAEMVRLCFRLQGKLSALSVSEDESERA